MPFVSFFLSLSCYFDYSIFILRLKSLLQSKIISDKTKNSSIRKLFVEIESKCKKKQVDSVQFSLKFGQFIWIFIANKLEKRHSMNTILISSSFCRKFWFETDGIRRKTTIQFESNSKNYISYCFLTSEVFFYESASICLINSSTRS